MKNWFILLLFITTKSFSQETELVNYSNSYGGKEYYVLKSNREVKHGSYIEYLQNNNNVSILVAGMFAYGKEQGQWDYFYTPIKIRKVLLTSSLMERVFYKDGLKHGLSISFYYDTARNMKEVQKYANKKSADSTTLVNLKDLKPRIIGEYSYGKRIGEWTSYDFNGNVIQIFNFTTSKLLYDQSVKDSLSYNTDRESLFLGGISEMNIAFNIRINPHIIYTSVGRDSTRAVIQFTVNKDGTVSDATILKSNGVNDFKNEALRLVASFNGHWLPALNNGTPVNRKYILAIDVLVNKRKWNGIGYKTKVTPLTNWEYQLISDQVLKDVNSFDKSLVEKLSFIEQLDKKDKTAFYIVLDAFIGKKKLKDALANVLNDVK